MRGGCEGSPPDPITRPGVKPPDKHRRGKARRSVANRELGMNLDRNDAQRKAMIRAIFRGQSSGPIRNLAKAREVN